MYTTMIVDDLAVFRQMIRAMPVWGENSGFIITEEASNGREALQKLMKKPVDLLLTDIRMPVVDGLELIKKATEQSLCGCIVIMSQFSDFEYARTGLSSGALDYLLKPVDPEALAKVIARAAASIEEKRLVLSRTNALEKILSQDAGDHFPEAEFDKLATSLSEGSLSTLGDAAMMVDVSYSELDFDLGKTAYVLNRAYKKLVDSVQAAFPWISKLSNLTPLKLVDFSKPTDLPSLKKLFSGQVGMLLSIIRKYELGIDNSSMVRMACRMILDNIDTDIPVGELSSRLFITRTYLSQVFREKTGMTLVKYITDVKIDRAKVLISNGSRYDEVAEKLGYKDDIYFKKLFKKTSGMTVGEFRSSISE